MPGGVQTFLPATGFTREPGFSMRFAAFDTLTLRHEEEERSELPLLAHLNPTPPAIPARLFHESRTPMAPTRRRPLFMPLGRPTP